MEEKQHSKKIVQAHRLGTVRIPSAAGEKLIHPDGTPLHQLPKDNEVEVVLARVENLLGKGHYGAALRDANGLKIDHSPLAGHYEFLRQEKISRLHIGIGDRYFIRGDKPNARRFYQRAIQSEPASDAVQEIVEMAGRVFDNLISRRRDLIKGLKESIREASFGPWCEKRRALGDFTILDAEEIRERISPDFRLEEAYGEKPPIDPEPGYIDPLPPESDFIAFRSGVPGALFKADAEGAVYMDLGAGGCVTGTRGQPVCASVAMPVVANVMMARVRLLALEEGLNLVGRAGGLVPLFRYEYLREKAREFISHIQRIESRMLPIQFKLDDFAELVDAVRRPLAEEKAELEAANQRVQELAEALAVLMQAEKGVADVVGLFHDAESQCECDWFGWLTAGAISAFGLFLVAMTAPVGTIGALLPVLREMGFTGLATGLFVPTVTCENVGRIGNAYERTLAGIRQAIKETEGELNHALMLRDILITRINGLREELSEVWAGNDPRLLDARTLGAVQAHYNVIRHSLLTRAQVVSRLAEAAFNFERDSEVKLIKDAYYEEERKGYTSAESLLRDLEGLDYIDITGRSRKVMQLSQIVSLQKHYPMSLVALKTAGRTRFTTALNRFDRWFPGTYLQRIKEVRVEVLVRDKPVPVRGYLSNDGVSFVRFHDPGNKRKTDDVHVFAEPDPDIERLCYKRFQQRRHMDTMAFPDFDSYLHEERMRKHQERERNFFENVGLESTWTIELLPDQPFELAEITDIRVCFQYEALFDENLKHVLEQKRYVGRREMIALSIRKLLEGEGRAVDFSETVQVKTTRSLFEAPVIDKRIINVGFAVKPQGKPHLEGIAGLEVSYQGAAAIRLGTNEKGIVATAPEYPAGTGLTELEAMAHGKSIDGTWTVRVIDLPHGLGGDDVDDIFLLLNYEYIG